MFVMEVYESRDGKLVSNVTSRVPVFMVAGLESGAGFDIALYAANKKGNSSVVHLSAFTLKGAEKHTGNLIFLLICTSLYPYGWMEVARSTNFSPSIGISLSLEVLCLLPAPVEEASLAALLDSPGSS